MQLLLWAPADLKPFGAERLVSNVLWKLRELHHWLERITMETVVQRAIENWQNKQSEMPRTNCQNVNHEQCQDDAESSLCSGIQGVNELSLDGFNSWNNMKNSFEPSRYASSLSLAVKSTFLSKVSPAHVAEVVAVAGV